MCYSIYIDVEVKRSFYKYVMAICTKYFFCAPFHEAFRRASEHKIVFSKGFHDFMSLVSIMEQVAQPNLFCANCL